MTTNNRNARQYEARLSVHVLLLIALVVLGGCRPAPKPAAPERARETLQLVLTAWQKGESPESLKSRRPSITATERKWRAGIQLIDFAIADNGETVGFDRHCRTTLRLRDQSGQETEEDALFSVSTSPALVVVRVDDGTDR